MKSVSYQVVNNLVKSTDDENDHDWLLLNYLHCKYMDGVG